MGVLTSVKNELLLLTKLGRLRMTIFSAVTYSTAYTLGLHYDHSKPVPSYLDLSTFDTIGFLWGWLFVLLCQLCAHFLGEYYDFRSDEINRHSSPFTGGSRVLVSGGYSPIKCLVLGWTSCILSLVILTFVLPQRVHMVGYVMVFLSAEYSGPPFRFNHRALGELNAALVMNVLLPYYSALLASSSFSSSGSILSSLVFYDRRLAMLVIPSALVKFALFIVLNMADRRSDWLAGKITLPVYLGDDIASRLHAVAMAAAYIGSIIIYLFDRARGDSTSTLVTLILILLSAPTAFSITSILNSSKRPYAITGLVFRSLQHAPLPLVAIFVDCFVKEALASGSILSHIFSLSFQVRCLPIYPYVYQLLFGRSPPPFILSPPQAEIDESTRKSEAHRVIIAGGGVAGYVLAICLRRLGIPYVLIEKRGKDTHDDGADLGLWPSSNNILKELGLDRKFWENSTYPVKKVHMTKLAKKKTGEVEDMDPNAKEDVMKVIDMAKVMEGTKDFFRLMGRRELMDALQKTLLDETEGDTGSNVMYSTRIVSITENPQEVLVTVKSDNGKEQELKGRIVVGADGINSFCRSTIASKEGKTLEDARYAGELCYRGVCDLTKESQVRDLFLRNEKAKPETMTIFYGEAIRASWGLISRDATKGFWWIKVKSESPVPSGDKESNRWPHPLKLLYDSTDKSLLYVHPVLDRVPHNKWCSERIVLVGDAAHPVTPNMGQGANMAIEDSFLLSVLLSRYYFKYPKDGHQEAFYHYFQNRYPHTTAIANESYQQSKMGQWTNPLLIKLRETVMRKLPSSIFLKKLKKAIWKEDPWIQEFKNYNKKSK